MLVDKQIREEISKGRIKIEPFDQDSVEPSAVYFRLGTTILVPEEGQIVRFETDSKPHYKKIDISKKPYILQPKEFVLAQTMEILTLPNDIGMLVDGRSTNARIGLSVHQTATMVLPGHSDSIITLELFNAGNFKIELKAGIRICKGIFFRSTEFASIGYKDMGLYRKQDEVMGAKLC